MHYVEHNGAKSDRLNIICGVPQGSILGPILFLIYINDITNASKLLHLILFADDTNIFTMMYLDPDIICTMQMLCVFLK
jgi:hypothetical protein